MNDEIEELEPEMPEVEELTEVIAEEPKPDFATKDDLNALADTVVARLAPVAEVEEEELPAFNTAEDLANFIRGEIAKGINAEKAAEAPAKYQQGMQSLTAGLDEVGKAYVSEMVARIEDPLMRAHAVTDPTSSEMLRLAALGKQAESTVRREAPPRTNTPASVESDNMSAEDRQDMKEFMSAFGVDAKRAKELVIAAKRNSGRN